MSNTEKLESFVARPTTLEIPNLPERLDKIIDQVSEFINKLNCNGESRIDVF